MSTEGLSEEAVLRLTVLSDLDKYIKEAGQANEETGFLDKSMVALENRLVALRAGIAGVAGEMSADAVATDKAAVATTKLAAAQEGAAAAGTRATLGLGGQRFALNSASTALGEFGLGLLAIPVLSAVIASDYQRDFANVQRATLLPIGAANALKQQLIDLSTQVPLTFKAITQIATAGAQLGIPASGLVQFTNVVAKLTATTQISAIAAENLFQKFYVLAGVKPDNFENLASAILNVSIHTGAAEAQVSLLATRIIGIAQQAGFTVPQVIALSAAFGSISAQSASYQMGTIVRLVGNLQSATESAGPSLQAFADTAGLTEKQVVSAFGTPKFAAYFNDFLAGLDKTKKAGGDVIAVLDDMGIHSIRDRAAILNLADAHAVFAKALKLADDGYTNSSLLNLHFQQVNETLKSQTTELISTFGALGNQLGTISTGPLTDVVDGVISATKAFSNFESTGFGQGATVFAASAAAILGSVILIASAGTKVGASFLAIRDAATVPAAAISKAYAGMAASASAAALAVEEDAAFNIQAAATLDAVGYSAAGATAAFEELAAAEGAASVSSVGTLGKLSALLAAGGPISATVVGGVAVAGAVALVAATSLVEQLNEQVVTQDGLTTSAATYGTQLKANSVTVKDYAKVLEDLNKGPLGGTNSNGKQTFVGRSNTTTAASNANLTGLVDQANLDKALSTAPTTQLISEYAKLVAAGKQVGDSQADIATKFPLAAAAYKNAIAANLGLATAAQQATEGIRNTATEGLQLDEDFGGAKAVTKLETAITKSISGLSGLNVALKDLTNPAKVVTESLADVTKQLNTNTTTANTWSANLRTVTLQYGNDVASQFISAGADATTESLLAQLVSATPAQGAKYKAALLANLNATTGAVAQQQLAAADLVNKNGSPIGAAEAAAISAELAAGVDFRTIAEKWGIELNNTPPLKVKVEVGADTTAAAESLNNFVAQITNVGIKAAPHTGVPYLPTITFNTPTSKVQGQTWATGGYTFGRENEPAGTVHGEEFVFSAPAVRAIGVSNLAMEHQRALQGYAGSGHVGNSAPLGGNGGSSVMPIVQLSPSDRALLTDIADRIGLTISGVALQGVVNGNNVQSSKRRVQ
jgi:hypothetical protein